MRKIELSYRLQTDRAPEARIQNDLMRLLMAVRTSGSISGAARELALSYRHVWGSLKDWEQTLGQALVIWERGQSARLTPFADKLLWTEQLAQARLAPQIEALRADLERTLSLAYDPDAHVLNLFASHDEALPLLQSFAAGHSRLHVDIRFCGSVEAIRALNEGRCVMAGFHARAQPQASSLTAHTYKPLLQPGKHKIIGFARRIQGLIVATGNPLRIDSLKRVEQWRMRFVNRSIGTGTRVLLDELLAEEGIPASRIHGYDYEELSHRAVAMAVASGRADVGLGTEAVARDMGLGFVALTSELYHLVCLKSAIDQPSVLALRQTLQADTWQKQLGTLPGYEPYASGEVQSLRGALPWWAYPRERHP